MYSPVTLSATFFSAALEAAVCFKSSFSSATDFFALVLVSVVFASALDFTASFFASTFAFTSFSAFFASAFAFAAVEVAFPFSEAVSDLDLDSLALEVAFSFVVFTFSFASFSVFLAISRRKSKSWPIIIYFRSPILYRLCSLFISSCCICNSFLFCCKWIV